MSSKRQAGFTFLELIFAITVMGVLFSLAMTVIIGMIRFYSFTNLVRNNQDQARSMLDTIVAETENSEIIIAAQNRLCIKSLSNQIVDYKLEGGSLSKTTYAKQGNDCGETQLSKITLNKDRMYITKFLPSVLTKGSANATNSKVTSLILPMEFISSNEVSSSCLPGDIYCNTFNLNTAVNVRFPDK